MEYFVSSGVAVAETTSLPIETVISPVTPSLSENIIHTINNFLPMGFTSTIDLPLIAIVFVRILIIIWVLKDSNYRSSSTFFCLLSLLLVTVGTPILWLPIYLAIRPLGYKHERNYWKAMNESMEEAEIVMDDDTEWENTEDEMHLAELRAQATLAEKRTRKTPTAKRTNTTNRKTTVKKNTSAKTVSNKIPTAKKAVTRTAQK